MIMTAPPDDERRNKRQYVSTRRAADAAQRRMAMVEVAIDMLQFADRPTDVTLDAVARKAGVTRVTLYNQFGSRRGLIEGIFEALAQEGGIAQLGLTVCHDDARVGLNEMIEIFVRFWTGNPAVGRVHAAMASDPEIATALAPRLSQGRKLIAQLVTRLTAKMDFVRRRDLIDLVEVLTDYPSVSMLARTRDPEMISALLIATCQRLIP
jgi:AcrR family transcriptional regulator